MEKPQWPFDLVPLSWGAESNLYITRYLGKKVVLKHRFPKKYMDPELALNLVKSRTLREASLLLEASKAGVRVPLPFYVDSSAGILVMKFVNGQLVKDVLERSPGSVEEISCRIGDIVRKLHNTDIIHGDLTTSNFMLADDGHLYLLDFGLAFKSKRPEDKATDIRVFERAVVSTHASLKDTILNRFLECYFNGLKNAKNIAERYKKLSLMGRYVKERRKSG